MERDNTILIVDDEIAGRETLEDMLVGQGYQLVFATNGHETLQKVAEIDPDLILLDVMMPDINGFEICQQLKSEKRWQHIPIIMVTALDATGDTVQGLDAGAEDFISKPVNSSELRARVRSMLRIKNQYDLLELQRYQLETALHLNKKLSRVYAQHLEALEILHQTGLRLMDNLNLDSVLGLTAQTILELIPEASGCLMHLLTDADRQLLPIVFLPKTYTKMVYPSLGLEQIADQVIGTGKAINLSDVKASLPQPQLSSDLGKINALLVTPLINQHSPIGALSVYSAIPNAFEEGDNHILSILANQVAVAISKARFFRGREIAQEREKWDIRNLFQRYVNPTVVDRLVDGRENLVLGGKRQKITVLFADIRGFTAFSENLSPERVVEALNQYLALAVEAILAEDGTLDKFMGDAVMAFFNAPLPQPDCTWRAVRSALAMQQAVEDYNKTKIDHLPLRFGVGIHSDEALVGNIGTAQQMNYTAIGDTVNLAKRLEEKAEGGQILLSQSIYQVIQNMVTVQDLGNLTLKGRVTSENVYLLTGLRHEIAS